MPPSKGQPAKEDPKGLYSTLGVSLDADEAEIRKAYRRLALRWHPDKNPDNPDATAEFQKISGAYEVLSDAERRSMYDATGCIDAEELDEADGLSRASDLFAAFFGGGFSEDMDADEQVLLDEFLRMTGGFSFKVGKGSRKKGRGGRSKRSGGTSNLEQQMLGQVLMAAMAGGGAMEFEATCPSGHVLKRKKAEGGYECDSCEKDIADGKRFYDCRKCDFSMCMKCYKKAEEEAAQEDEEEDERAMLFEAFCEEHITPERQGGRLRFRCGVCNGLFNSQVEAVTHMGDAHEDELEAALAECSAEFSGAGPSSMDLEAMFMAQAMEEMMGGMMGPPMGGGYGGAAPKARRKKKR
eukprot:TRINITY_DN48105_c0_g1_i1.p1 TRINITY_DN48105_c0_g1~~TRINITY_DN48105_c0_g1_i1.p1  ORF type:complete len:353 (+),score=96.42 TRINITY_DN48105_c0_g1_i1:60-1118(+)